jgi:hypothetical protein
MNGQPSESASIVKGFVNSIFPIIFLDMKVIRDGRALYFQKNGFSIYDRQVDEAAHENAQKTPTTFLSR